MINDKIKAPDTDPLFQSYQAANGIFDELMDESGATRTDWLPLMDALKKMGQEELKQRHTEIQSLLRENGVTYNVYSDPAGLYRPWKLDPIPFIINKQEWETLEKGLIQRARLLNMILSDIYSNRSLIKNKFLPLDLIYTHEGFLRPCNGTRLPGQNQLFLYAADIARDRNGRFWVINDRTQAPSGSGYALENRTVTSSVLPEVHQNYQVRRITRFFNTLYNSLVKLSPSGKLNPRIVLLTPGPENETFFEHAYLSSFLGINLVQGEDLTVRDGFVWLKTIRGLEKIDIILRRVDDSFCDPLELRADSRLGVAGLLEVVRQGNVVIANPLGSSVLENPGLMSFLPGLCRHFFNEELLLPGLNTWWCGQPKELQYVLENLDHLTIKLTSNTEGSRTISNGYPENKEKLRRMIRSRPWLYVAHESITASTSPSFIDGETDSRLAVIRCFVVANDGGYEVMQGGLTRASARKGVLKISNQEGGISKDTWVLGNSMEGSRQQAFSPFHTKNQQEYTLPSRTAENVFWAGRYSSRAKVTARFVMQVLLQLNEYRASENNAGKEALEVLVKALANMNMPSSCPLPDTSSGNLKEVERTLLEKILISSDPGSLKSTLLCLKRSIFAVRDRWPSDIWQVMNNIDLSWKGVEQAEEVSSRAIQTTLENIIDALVAFTGLNEEAVPRDAAFMLHNTGRRLERALQLISQIRSCFTEVKEDNTEYTLMESVLSGNLSLSIYRSNFRSYLQIENFLDLLLYNPANPSSLTFQLDQLKESLSHLPDREKRGRMTEEERQLLEACANLQKTDITTLAGVNKDQRRKSLESLMDQMQNNLIRVSDILVARYFIHSESSERLSSMQSQQPEI